MRNEIVRGSISRYVGDAVGIHRDSRPAVVDRAAKISSPFAQAGARGGSSSINAGHENIGSPASERGLHRHRRRRG